MNIRDYEQILVVRADYDISPLWLRATGVAENVAAADLGLSREVQMELEAWMQDFNSRINRASPQDSPGPSREVRLRSDERGLQLARMIAEELPRYQVVFESDEGVRTEC